MNVGDIYEKDGKRYEILQVLMPNTYSMREVKETPVLEEEVPPIIAEKKTRKRRKV